MEDGAVVKRLSGLGSLGEVDEILDRVGRLIGKQAGL